VKAKGRKLQITMRRLRQVLPEIWNLPGPGVITGASDDDPSGIATYSLAGAKTGYSLLWTAVLTVPLMAAVQNMCARIGLATGSGLASALRRHYPRPLLMVTVLLLLLANTINIAADIEAVAAGIDLLTGLPEELLVAPVGILIAVSEIVIPYRIFANYLKALTLALFAYVIDAFLAGPDWAKTLRGTLLPSLHFDPASATTLVGVLGTTISPYLFFWQTSEEVEEMHRQHISLGDDSVMRREALDVDAGMLLSNVVAYFVIMTTAATLYAAGVHDISTARQAAEALRPLAGSRASVIFAAGMVGTGLLSIPVLAASSAYAVAEVFEWKEGLEEEPRRAPQFYLVIALSTLIGLVIALSKVGAIRALFIAAVVNGAISPVLIAIILAVSNDRRVLGRHVNGRMSNVLGALTVAIMGASAAGMAATLLIR